MKEAETGRNYGKPIRSMEYRKGDLGVAVVAKSTSSDSSWLESIPVCPILLIVNSYVRCRVTGEALGNSWRSKDSGEWIDPETICKAGDEAESEHKDIW